MKQLYLLLAICLAFLKAEATVIVKAEYFWDTDPGIGNATNINIPLSSQLDSVNITHSISTAGLPSGTHFLYIRTKDNDGHWSLTEGMLVNVVPTIVDYEHFWDTDPGVGNGAGFFNLPFSHLDSVNITQTINTGALSAGVHFVFYRTRDSEGKWSLTESKMVNIISKVTTAEYFWDDDPGIGSGTAITIPNASQLDSVNITETISTVGMPSGTHFLYVRTKDSDNRWSLSEGLAVNIVAKIDAFEYFWDTDPGFLNGNATVFFTHLDSVNLTQTVSTAGLSAGVHHLYYRTYDSDKRWSLSEGRAVEVKPYIVKGEYFFNTDPGIGNATLAFTAPVGSPADSINSSYNFTAPANYGRYYHYLRTMDNFGHWSLTEQQNFLIEMLITDVEYFFDTDPGVGNGINIPVTPNDTVELSNLSIPTTSLSAGHHQLYIRAKNDHQVWTVIDSRTFYVEPLVVPYTNTELEYFIDTDPGVGAATQIPIADADTLTLNNYAISLTGVSQGFHQLYVRAKNNLGVWSTIDTKPFFIEEQVQMATITALEYFYDVDPGAGNGLPLALPTAPNDTMVLNADLTLPCLTNGTHHVWLRAKNNLNVWSVVDYDTLTVGSMVAKSIASLGPDTVCFPSTVTMFADSAVGISYQWLNNGLSITGANFAAYTASTTGNYTLRQTCNSVVAVSNVKNVVVNNVPDITFCPSVAPVDNDGGLCSAIVIYSSAIATGSSPLPIITYSQNSGTAFPVGTTPIYVVATNLCGVDSCQFNVEVADTALPVISNCPANVIVNSTTGLCTGIATWAAPTAADNCGIQSLTSSHNSGATFPVGTTSVTYTATDIHGNVQTCSFNIVVTDSELPIISNCPANISVNNLVGSCGAAVTWMEPIASDNCGVQSFTASHTSGSSFQVGTTTVTYTATDIHGNVQTCSFNVTVVDSELPVISSCPAGFITCNTSPALGTLLATDNCGIQSIVNDAPLVFQSGFTTVTWTVTDINGNMTTCTQIIEVNFPSKAPTSISSDDQYQDFEICNGDVVTLTQQGGGLGSGANYHWYTGACGGTSVGVGPAITVNPTATTTYFVRVEGVCGISTCVQLTITVKTTGPSGTVQAVTAPVSACAGNTLSVSTTAIGNTSYYNWSGPAGTTFNGITSPARITDNNPVVVLGNPLSSGWTLCVQGENACGVTQNTRCTFVRGALSQPGAISGNTVACPNTAGTYSIVPVAGAEFYTWTITGNATITGNGTSAIVNYGPSFTTGIIGVSANLNCGTASTIRYLNISTTPLLPGAINGPSVVCPNTTHTFSIAAVAGATAYVWTACLGTTVVNNGTSATITFPSNLSSCVVSVSAVSACGGTSPLRSKSIASGLPLTSANITGAGVNLCGATNIPYATAPVASAISYQWSIAGGSIVAGQGTSSIIVNWQSLTPAGNLSVAAVNSCGAGSNRTKPINLIPGQPGTIATANVVMVGDLEQASIPSLGTGVNYTWSSNPVGLPFIGQGNHTVFIDYGTAIPGAYVISCTPSNACGNSNTRTISITVAAARSGNRPMDGWQVNTYPNPATSVCNVEVASTIAGQVQLTLTDLTDQLVWKGNEHLQVGSNKFEIKVSDLAKGIYLLKVVTASGVQTLQVVVQ